MATSLRERADDFVGGVLLFGPYVGLAIWAFAQGHSLAFSIDYGPSHFPWSHFIILGFMNLLYVAALVCDDRQYGADFFGEFRMPQDLMVRWQAGWFWAFFAFTGIVRYIYSFGAAADREIAIRTFFVAVWWAMWLGSVWSAVAGIVRHVEGLLYLIFTLSGQGRRFASYVEGRRRAMDRQELDQQEREIDREETSVRRKIEAAGGTSLAAFFTELQSFENVPQDLTEYRGFVGEAYRRWVERQKQRTIEVTRERIEELGELYRAWAEVQIRKRDMVRARAALAPERVERVVRSDELAEKIAHDELLLEQDRIEMKRARIAAERARANREREALESPDTRRAFPAGPIVLGESAERDDGLERVALPEGLRVRHVYMIGQTQTGKTTLIQNLVRQDIEQGRGCAFIDPHGDAVPELLGYVPESRIEDVVYLDFTSWNPVVAFNPLDAPKGLRQGLVEDFLSFFARYFATDATAAPRMTAILRASLLTLLATRSPKTVADLERFLIDSRYRQEVLHEVEDQDIRAHWQGQYAELKRTEVQPILTRLSALLAPGSQLRAILTQRKNRINFKELLDNGKVLLVRLSRGQGLEQAAHFLSALIITRIQQEAMSRGEMPAAQRRPFYLYVDEFQTYTVTSFETILAESAKYRLSVTMANQTFQTLPASLKGAILGNVGTVVSFRVGSEDAAVIHREMRARVETEGLTPAGRPTVHEEWWPSAEDLKNQRPHRAFVRLGRPEAVEEIRTLALPPRPRNSKEIAQEVVRLSQKRYYAERQQERSGPEDHRGPAVAGGERAEQASPGQRKGKGRPGRGGEEFLE
jgi:hypothetical protein